MRSSSITGSGARSIACVFAAAVVLSFCGCGGPFQLAPVSGVVSLNGEPLEGAMVRFQPQRSGAEVVLGPASLGVTDSAGRYSLQTHTRETGAVVGAHSVSISTFDQRLVDPKNSDKVEVVSKERVPKQYHSPSELRFDVKKGQNEANFDLVGK